ncbi:succinate dehydrogenase cytochrome b558 subunit [Pasteuria penetrans]|uniref:succinate dehydrogenase cytochrome b558 subunit n=1 Tax=Pasteuria penetrans TaxID=86005 RepID=UPI000FB88A61|nr:succinate dehydrogenase cytochrome b558 subunit [Pasteuria penetrans]
MEQVAKRQNDYSSFFSRRLHSLLGVIPVGFFLINHLLTNHKSALGAKAFIDQVEWIHGLPLLWLMEFLFIFLPLMYHGVYGLYVAFTARNNLDRYGTFRNVLFFLQRVTGVITFAFILWHLWETRLQVWLEKLKPSDMAPMMVEILSSDWKFVFYALGILAATFHFSNGMWSFLVTWGVTVGPRAQLFSMVACAVAFALLTYLGIGSLFGFRAADFYTKSLG